MSEDKKKPSGRFELIWTTSFSILSLVVVSIFIFGGVILFMAVPQVVVSVFKSSGGITFVVIALILIFIVVGCVSAIIAAIVNSFGKQNKIKNDSEVQSTPQLTKSNNTKNDSVAQISAQKIKTKWMFVLISTSIICVSVGVLVLLKAEPNSELTQNPNAIEVASPSVQEDTVSVMGDAVNYMHEASVQYTLYDLSQTPPMAVGGAIVDPLSQGGGKGCCIALPKNWHAGMKVRVEWRTSDFDHTYEQPSQDLEIPPYDEAADLYVVFHGKNEIELVVSQAEPGHPNWRGKIKETPWDACVAKNGRKPCFMALPKQFDTESSKGFCTYQKRKKFADGEELCLSATSRCMKDFEDQAFCDGILWAKEPTCEEQMGVEWCKVSGQNW